MKTYPLHCLEPEFDVMIARFHKSTDHLVLFGLIFFVSKLEHHLHGCQMKSEYCTKLHTQLSFLLFFHLNQIFSNSK